MTDQNATPPPGYNQGWRPVPDPTVLTTEALQREVAGLGAILRAEMAGKYSECMVRFEAIEERFGMNERQRLELKLDTQKAVDAALSAAKEAVADQTAASDKAITKGENSAKEQSTQQYATVKAELDAQAAITSDLKDRLTKLESRSIGAAEARVDPQSDVLARLIAIEQNRVGAREHRTEAITTTQFLVGIALAVLTVVGFILTQAT